MLAVPPSPAKEAITLQQLSSYPLRIAQCISMILAHEQEICAYSTGTLELHYHEQTVSGKHMQRWVT